MTKASVASENRIIQRMWNNKNFCFSMNWKALCLICSESIAVLEVNSIVRHHNSKHEGNYCCCYEKRKSDRLTKET
jgi:hypothetical protein